MWFFLLTSLLIATGDVQVHLNPIDTEGAFARTLERALARLEVAAAKRPFRLKNLNDSLEKMALASQGMRTEQSPAVIQSHLIDARKLYPQNYFSILLEAVLVDSQADRAASSRLLEEFLIRSRTFTEFEEAFIKWAEFHQIRRYVYDLLLERGIDFKGREKEIQVQIPFAEFFRYAMSPDRPDVFYVVFFVASILIGAVLLILGHFMEVDFSRPILRNLPAFYVMIWLSYGVWIMDLAFGLPFEWKRSVVIPILLVGSAGYMTILEGISYYKERNRPLEEGYRRCPHCRQPVVLLAIECPHCRRKLDS